MNEDEDKSSQQIMVAIVVLPLIAIGLFGFITTKLPDWAYRNHLLVDSAEAVVPLPGDYGYGLDWRRLLLVLAVLVAVGAFGFAMAREKLKAMRNLELNTDAEMSRDEAEHELRMAKHKEDVQRKWWDDLK